MDLSTATKQVGFLQYSGGTNLSMKLYNKQWQLKQNSLTWILSHPIAPVQVVWPGSLQ